MRVLVVHNEYRSAMPSGENQVVAAEVEMLRAAGVEVDTYFRASDEIEDFGPVQRATLAVRPIYSFEDSRWSSASAFARHGPTSCISTIRSRSSRPGSYALPSRKVCQSSRRCTTIGIRVRPASSSATEPCARSAAERQSRGRPSCTGAIEIHDRKAR